MEDIKEKIQVLLSQGSEHEKLDYKRSLDITKQHDLVEITKDIAAMLSSGGGSLLIGADDAGRSVSDFTDELFVKFDETTLRSKLKKYINEPFSVFVAGCQFDGFNFILIECEEHTDGFVILKADGQYLSGKKTKEIFRSGDIFVRHGSASERWQQHDVQRIVNGLVSKQKQDWLKEAEFIISRIGKTSRPEVEEKQRLKKVLGELKSKIEKSNLSKADIELALDEVSVTAIKAIHDDSREVFKICVETLQNFYALGFDHKGNLRLNSSFNPVDLWYEILIRIPLIGGACIEAKEYELAKHLVLQKVPGDPARHYTSWYRHALTMSARSNYTPQDRSPLVASTDLFRNNVRFKNILSWDDEEGRTYLTRFDYLACIFIVDNIQKVDDGEFYTSFAFYDKERVTQMLVDILLDPQAISILFKSSPEHIAYIIQEVDRVGRLVNFYWRGGSWPHGLDEFLKKAKSFEN